jgi:hypothetical protein
MRIFDVEKFLAVGAKDFVTAHLVTRAVDGDPFHGAQRSTVPRRVQLEGKRACSRLSARYCSVTRGGSGGELQLVKEGRGPTQQSQCSRIIIVQ